MTDSEQSPNGGFLGRWARRKQSDRSEGEAAVTEVTEATADAVVTEPDSAIATVDESAKDDGECVPADEPALLTDADMPPIESLGADSDYSPFLSEGVSKKLRNMALKKLFFSGNFAIRDGLDDYDDDFTRFEPLGDIVTSDMKFHQRRKEKARLAKLEEDRLKEEAENKLAEQQQDDDVQSAEDHGNSPEPHDQEAVVDQADSAPEPPVDSTSSNEDGEAVEIAAAGLHGFSGGNEVSGDTIKLPSPHAKLTKIPSQPAQENTDTGQSEPSDETKRDQT